MPDARISGHRFHYHPVNGCVLLRPEGPCDESTTKALAELANSRITESKDLIIDLSHADYVESPGFRWLVRQVRHLESQNRKLILTGLCPSVDRAFRLLRLDRIIPAADDVSEALEISHGKKEPVGV